MEKLLVEYDNKYLVTSDGDVYSLKGKKKKLVGKVCKSGYRMILINHNNVRKYLLVHRLVMLSFSENKENKRTVNHIDGNKLNNRLDNLEWATDSENQLHAIKNGLSKCKITKDIANKIRSEIGSCRAIGIKYNLSKTHVAHIKRNLRWRISI